MSIVSCEMIIYIHILIAFPVVVYIVLPCHLRYIYVCIYSKLEFIMCLGIYYTCDICFKLKR